VAHLGDPTSEVQIRQMKELRDKLETLSASNRQRDQSNNLMDMKLRKALDKEETLIRTFTTNLDTVRDESTEFAEVLDALRYNRI